MIIYNNEITVHRGESFTLERAIVNQDGSPYIVSKFEENPYLAITVAAARYDQTGRYNKTWWLSLKDFPRFKYTVPKTVQSFVSRPGDDAYDYVYTNGTDYKYWDGTEYVDYAFSFVKAFDTDITNEWIEQSYMYDIKHVYGNSTRDYLVELCNEYDPDYLLKYPSASSEDIYDHLASIDEAYVEGIDYTSPIYDTKIQTILLRPTKLTVQSYLRRL